MLRIITITILSLLVILFIVSCNSSKVTDIADTEVNNEAAIHDAVVNVTQKEVSALEYHNITPYKLLNSSLPGVSEGYACVAIAFGDNSGFAYVDTDGNILNNTFYNFAYSFNEDGRALVQLSDTSWRYINTKGEDIGPYEEENPPYTPDTSMFYEENGKFGLLDAEGNKITEPVFDGVAGFTDGYAPVFSLEQGFMYIDREGNIIKLPEAVRNSHIDNGRIYCKFQNDCKYGVLDLNGNELLPKRYDALVNCDNKYYAIIEDNKLGLIDLSGNEIVSPTLDCDYSEDLNIGYGEGYITLKKDNNLAFAKIVEDNSELYFDITLEDGENLTLKTDENSELFEIIQSGEISFDGSVKVAILKDGENTTE